MPLYQILFVVILLLTQGATTATAQYTFQRVNETVAAGRSLSADEIKALEKNLNSDDNELESRLKLLGYYFDKQGKDDAAKARRKHVYWLIRNHPKHEAALSPIAFIHPESDPQGSRTVTRLWLDQAEKHGEDATILATAAAMIMHTDNAKAEQFLKKAQTLEPDNAQWSERLGYLYKRDHQKSTGDKRRQLAQQSMAEFERALSQHADPSDTYTLLNGLAAVAYEAGDVEKASLYAEQLLERSKEDKDHWHNGNAVHDANTVLGRIAIQSKNIDEAKSRLLASAQIMGSPQLNSRGPKMILAKELLENGEKDVVVEYLDLCSQFWKNKQLDEWKAAVAKGDIPDFGANLAF